MRGRITRVFCAAAAAGATTVAFTAGAASAATAPAAARTSPLTGRSSNGRPIYSTANCFGFGGPLLRETGYGSSTPPPRALVRQSRPGEVCPVTGRSSNGRPISSTANCFGFGGPLLSETGDGSATPPPCALSGYQARSRDFRFVQALITVRKHARDGAADPMG